MDEDTKLKQYKYFLDTGVKPTLSGVPEYEIYSNEGGGTMMYNQGHLDFVIDPLKIYISSILPIAIKIELRRFAGKQGFIFEEVDNIITTTTIIDYRGPNWKVKYRPEPVPVLTNTNNREQTVVYDPGIPFVPFSQEAQTAAYGSLLSNITQTSASGGALTVSVPGPIVATDEEASF